MITFATLVSIAAIVNCTVILPIVIVNSNIRDNQESLVIEASNSPIINIERYGNNQGIALTANGQVWLLDREYVCQSNMPPSIGIYIDKSNGFYILTEEMMIIGYNSYHFDDAIQFFNSIRVENVRSLQLITFLNQCEVVTIGEEMKLDQFDSEFIPRIIAL